MFVLNIKPYLKVDYQIFTLQKVYLEIHCDSICVYLTLGIEIKKKHFLLQFFFIIFKVLT